MSATPGNITASLPDNARQPSAIDNVIASAPRELVLPRDGRVISLLLQAQGVKEVEPKVVSMLLEFSHRKSIDFLYVR